MMQNPLVGYPSFSHFLELRHQQYSSRPPMTATPSSTSPPPPHFMYTPAFRPSLTPLNNESSLSGSPSPNNAKSFTIDAILGLRDAAKYPTIATDLSINSTRAVNSNSNSISRQQHGAGVGLLGLHQATNYASSCSRRSLEKSSDVLSGTVSKKSAKSKRVRTIFTPEQLERLEAEFERQQYMVGPERLYLAHALQLTEAQVKVWFQNRRIKWRKQHLEMQQQRLAVIKQQQLQQQQLHGEEMDDSDTDSNSGDDNSCYSATTPSATSASTSATTAVVGVTDGR